MFQTVKQNVSLLEVVQKKLEIEFVQIGDNTFGPEDKTCPFCGHKDCFRIKHDEANLEESFYKCFSCDEGGDVINFIEATDKISSVDAAKALAKEYSVQLPNDYSPIQEIFTLASRYYQNLIQESGSCAELNGLTPLEYQCQIRRHTLTGINNLQVGWSDGGVVDYLLSLGIDSDLLRESGLVNKKNGDFLPRKCFIYPHLVRGRVSHFTFKDPLKQKEYQLPNKFKLNGYMFYNSDSIFLEGPVILVEGENDVISVSESEWNSGVIGCIGQISSGQLEWLSTNLSGRDVVTIFDSDPAGDKYREKVGKLRKNFSSLTQVKLSGVKDIDEFLKNGGNLKAALDNFKVEEHTTDPSVEIDGEETGTGSILEKDGAYHKIRYKDGVEFTTKLTNFTIKLRNIFIRGAEREREVLIIREDGRTSEPVIIPSEAKVAVRPFKTLIANAIDATYYGKEDDLNLIWEHIYSKDVEKEVLLPEVIGRMEILKGWLFRDFYITDSGASYNVDEEGVLWVGGTNKGIRPMSLDISQRNMAKTEGPDTSIPTLNRNFTTAERDELLKGFIENLSSNLNVNHERLGDVLTMVGWVWSSVYSNTIFSINNNFPFLKIWGDKDRGKTTIIKWLLDLFGMSTLGYTTISSLNSGVGWGRKMAYFSSLPMTLDELRADRSTTEFYSTLRGYYDRASRDTGARDSNGIRRQEVRATLILGGQDMITDPATLSRCIVIRLPKANRDKAISYNWIRSREEDLSAIGYHWVSSYSQFTPKMIAKGLKELQDALRVLGVPSRTAINWSVAGFFANKLAEQYFPHFKYLEYLKNAAVVDTYSQEESNMVCSFFEIVEGMQVGDKPAITGDHIRAEGDYLYIWFPEVFRIASRESRGDGEPFSKRAILEAIREEDYFVEEGRAKMGMSEHMRRVIKLDIKKTPEVMKNIASFCMSS